MTVPTTTMDVIRELDAVAAFLDARPVLAAALDAYIADRRSFTSVLPQDSRHSARIVSCASGHVSAMWVSRGTNKLGAFTVPGPPSMAMLHGLEDATPDALPSDIAERAFDLAMRYGPNSRFGVRMVPGTSCGIGERSRVLESVADASIHKEAFLVECVDVSRAHSSAEVMVVNEVLVRLQAFAEQRKAVGALQAICHAIQPEAGARLAFELVGDATMTGKRILKIMRHAMRIEAADRHLQAILAAPILRRMYLAAWAGDAKYGPAARQQLRLVQAAKRVIPSIAAGDPLDEVVDEVLRAGFFMHDPGPGRLKARTSATLRALPDFWRGHSTRVTWLSADGSPDPLGILPCAVIDFHDAYPNHRALLPTEVENARMALASVDEHAGFGNRPGARARIMHALLDRTGTMVEPPAGLRDMVNALWRSAEIVALGATIPISIPMAIIDLVVPDGRRIGGLRDAVQRWHRNQHAWQTREAAFKRRVRARLMPEGTSDVQAFPHLWDKSHTFAGVTLTPFRDDEAFLSEGEDMRHCIAGYRHGAARGHHVVVSFADDEGRRSTASMTVTDDGVVLVEEHRGPKNTHPMPTHEAVLEGMIKGIPPDRIRRFVLAREALRTVPDDQLDLWMTDDERAEFIALHFAQIAEFLPRQVADAGPKAWSERAMPGRAIRKTVPKGNGPLADIGGVGPPNIAIPPTRHDLPET